MGPLVLQNVQNGRPIVCGSPHRYDKNARSLAELQVLNHPVYEVNGRYQPVPGSCPVLGEGVSGWWLLCSKTGC